MKKIFSIIIMVILLINGKTVNAEQVNTNREDLLEDAVIDLLQLQEAEAIKAHYGTTYNIGTFCERIAYIKKKNYPNPWKYEVNLEFATFTGAHNLRDIFNVTIRREWKDLKWVVKEYKVRKLETTENYDCRKST